MKTIKVNASKPYEILLGKGLIDNIALYIKNAITCQKIVVVTDSNVNGLYGKTVEKKLKESGYEVFVYQFLAGEKSKNIATYIDLISFIAKHNLQRGDCLLALGGGVVGDITGFAAATFLRGIKYVQVPTTLLAIIDSSVGGKTGIDLAEGKNLLGAFYQPDLVVADINLLSTLPKNEVKNGKGELIKYGVLAGGKLWDLIEKGENVTTCQEMLEMCINYKKEIVQIDEKESSVRKLLNLGHTVGHAIEKLSAYQMSHGACVALGIAISARSAFYRKELNEVIYNKIMAVLKQEEMPTESEYEQNMVIDAALNDKKRKGNFLTMVTIKDIGNCALKDVPIEGLGEYFICK